jgi:hypothetical protein
MKNFFLFLLLAGLLYGKPVEPGPLDKQIIYLTFNEDYDLAKKICQEQININPKSPKYYYYIINAKILEIGKRVGELDLNKRDESRKNLNKEIINYCENVIDKFDVSKLNIEDKFYYGTIYGYLARVYGTDGSWWSAFKAGKKSKNIMEEILKSDPSFYDAYLVMGMLEYYADRMSGITSFIAGVLGLSGDRTTGLNHLQLAYEKGTLTFGQASLTLIEVNSNLEGNELAALSYYENFLRRFPKNRRILNPYFHSLLNTMEFKKAENLLKNDKQNLLDNYARSRFYDIKGNSQLAIQYGEHALENENNLVRNSGSSVRYIVAFNSWLTSDWTRVSKYEQTLNDRGKELFYLNKKFEKESRWLHDLSLMISNDKSVGEVENFVNSKPYLNNAKGFEDQFNLSIGAFYFKNNLYNEAERFLSKSVNAEDARDKFNACKYLVDIYMRQNVDKYKVENLISAIKDAKNDRLTYRSKDLEKKYNL